MHCLIVDHNRFSSRLLNDGLLAAAHDTATAFGGESGLSQALARHWDVIVIDAALPGPVDALALIRAIRSLGHRTPVIVLGVPASPEHIAAVLQNGADDYLARPVVMIELAARIEALCRRSSSGMYALQLRVDDLMLDAGTMRVSRGTCHIVLQQREFRLLEYLMRNEGQLLTREALLKSVWHYEFEPNTNIVEVHISRLRSKVDKPFPLTLIHTVRGGGYILSAQPPSVRLGRASAAMQHAGAGRSAG